MITEPSTASSGNILTERMVFGWWNTSLSPVGIDRSDDTHRRTAGEIVKWLIDDLNVDCLALGEISDSDLTFLRSCSGSQNLAIYDGTLKAGRLQFDTGAIYNKQRLSVNDEKSIISAHGGRNLKVANRIDFISASDKSVFHLFVSHWPSRSYAEENILHRETLAARLKDQIKTIHDDSPNASIILMGDFNDEPFDKSLSYHLLATRDRHLARTKQGVLYNPFWRHVGEAEPYILDNITNSSAGSCYYKGGTETRWRTFDQIMFSSAFLGSSDWHLNEQKTTILRTDFLVNLVQNADVYFDHLPILSVIERKTPTQHNHDRL